MTNDELLANVTEIAGSKVLPPCVILAKIGQGGMGAVYRARHLNLDIDVAVKVLKPQLVADDPQFISRFRREGQSAAKIRHQNVLGVYDVAESGGLHYIIMELVVGETARQRVERKGPLAVGEALQLIYEAALGLGEAHRLGFVHRDIKPDNLLVSNSGQVKVADLGLAKPTLGGGGQSLVSSPYQIMGTPSYMPPEQWETTSVTSAANPPSDRVAGRCSGRAPLRTTRRRLRLWLLCLRLGLRLGARRRRKLPRFDQRRPHHVNLRQRQLNHGAASPPPGPVRRHEHVRVRRDELLLLRRRHLHHALLPIWMQRRKDAAVRAKVRMPVVRAFYRLGQSHRQATELIRSHAQDTYSPANLDGTDRTPTDRTSVENDARGGAGDHFDPHELMASRASSGPRARRRSHHGVATSANVA